MMGRGQTHSLPNNSHATCAAAPVSNSRVPTVPKLVQMMHTNNNTLPSSYQSFIHLSRYARWLPEKGRKETWQETVDRYVTFMSQHVVESCGVKLPQELWQEVRMAILNLNVMPSMRALMCAGPALRKCHMAAYNCSYLPISDTRAFDEILYILMSGTGVGFSVETKYVECLPVVPKGPTEPGLCIVVQDSREGWAHALRQVIAELYAGRVPTWDVSLLRPAGAPLRTFGGRASGPEPLIDLFRFVVATFESAHGRQLTSLECHDIVCKIADIVVAGGVRRSALISLSSVDDELMRHCKSGDWWATAPHRALANVSACYEQPPDEATFAREWQALYDSKSGERGIFSRSAVAQHSRLLGRREVGVYGQHYGTNPCCETILRPYGLCNLTEVVVRAVDSPKDLQRKVRVATVLGTIQSTLVNFGYVRSDWHRNQSEERLLGVSLTGIMDNELTAGSKGLDVLGELLESLRRNAIDTNAALASTLGIPASAAITCLKPSGTVSQLVDAASGIHPRHSLFYIRRVRGSNMDPITRFLVKYGCPHEPCVMNPTKTTVFSFPMRSPSCAILRDQLTAEQHLELCKTYQHHYCMHKVSSTISIRSNEWDTVKQYVQANFEALAGVSFLPYDTGCYAQTPYEAIDQASYTKLVRSMPRSLPWTELASIYSEGPKAHALACTSPGNCEAVDIESTDTQPSSALATAAYPSA
jgi:ribonucleoside-diphosphate reductase alpha chain